MLSYYMIATSELVDNAFLKFKPELNLFFFHKIHSFGKKAG